MNDISLDDSGIYASGLNVKLAGETAISRLKHVISQYSIEDENRVKSFENNGSWLKIYLEDGCVMSTGPKCERIKVRYPNLQSKNSETKVNQ